MAGHEPSTDQQQLFDSILKCAELSQKPVALLQSLQAGDVESVDLEQLLQLLFDLNDVTQKSASLAAQLFSSQPGPSSFQPGEAPRRSAAEVRRPAEAPRPLATPPVILLPPVPDRPPHTPAVPCPSQHPTCSASSSANSTTTTATARSPSEIQPQGEPTLARSSTGTSAAAPVPRPMAVNVTSETLLQDAPLQVLIASAAHENFLQTRCDGHVVFANATVPPGTNLHVWKLHSLAASCGQRLVAIQNVGNGRYLCADPGGHLQCDRTALKEWERWSLVRKGGDETTDAVGSSSIWALRSYHGHFLCVEAFGCPRWPLPWLAPNACKAVANRPECNAWEHFALINAPPGSCFVSDV